MTQAKCNLIIDSCCDLPREIVDREGVTLLEFPYTVEEATYTDDMYKTLAPSDFYGAMRKGMHPFTAQAPITRMNAAFEAAVESGVPTVFLCFSSALSGTYSTALLLQEHILSKNPDAELYVVDTLLASVAEGLLVYEAIKQRDKGMTAKQLVEWAEEARYFVNAAFMVEDLESLKRGGRISASVAFAGAKLDVKPLLGFDLSGSLTLTGVARGRKKGIRYLADFYQQGKEADAADGYVLVANADCPKDADRLKGLVRKGDEDLWVLESSIGPVIGSHVGPDMLAVVFWGNDRRKSLSVADRIAHKVRNVRG